jgi:FkbM family methyltransferase
MESVITRIIKYMRKRIKNFLFENKLEYYDNQLKVILQTEKQIVKLITGMEFYGQVGQDMLAYLYFGAKKDGFYVDIGAYDGKIYSNTFIFEKIGWNGICVEPLPDVYGMLIQNRQCDCFNVAIAEESGELIEYIKATGVEMLSGLNNQMTEVHKKRILNEMGEIEKIYVKTLSFNDLMNGYPDRRNIDFLSIDVEGAEISILKAIDFNKFSFGLITVENNEEELGSLIQFMQEQGYKVYLNLETDIMFIKDIK